MNGPNSLFGDRTDEPSDPAPAGSPDAAADSSAASSPGAWGPKVRGGRRWSWLRPALVVVASMLVVLAGTGAATAYLLYRTAESSLTRVPVGELAEPTDPNAPLNVLVVGSDSRQGLSAERRQELDLGAFEGQRSDTMLLVSITPDRDNATVVSFPRDLMVYDDGEPTKLADTFAGGADNVVDVLGETFEIPIHHYVQVSVPGFLEVVETVGNVEVCLDEPLVDEKSGADLVAGCQELTPEQALAYVRSREGARGDFRRIERQQEFLQGMLDKVVSAGSLVNLPRLFQLVEEGAANVVTDESLAIGDMRRLAQDLRGLASGDVPMTFVPGFPHSALGASFVVRYAPGTEPLFDAIRQGEKVPPRGSGQQRGDTNVVVWHAGNIGDAGVIESTLHWAGFSIQDVGRGGPEPASTTVYAAPGSRQQAGWAAATLGSTVRPWPEDTPVPDGASVAVAVGTQTELEIPDVGVDEDGGAVVNTAVAGG